jgi:hypothetical protein
MVGKMFEKYRDKLSEVYICWAMFWIGLLTGLRISIDPAKRISHSIDKAKQAVARNSSDVVLANRCAGFLLAGWMLEYFIRAIKE